MVARRQPLAPLYAVIALLIAVFVAPAVDAAVCAPEPLAIHAAADHSQDGDHAQDDDGARDVDHGLCSHGHCHHVSVERPAPWTEHAVATPGEDPPPIANERRPSVAAEGLKRPPRA
jgi:hypothetical protein